ncbi:DUF6221 family protein [Isoptericola sp. NPDC057653]|uniref:DUF6221 family protein n=1 Tax=Isoptericola sp. NPDC057653 TaxID=3346195 RepID=UPI0036A7A02A
MTLTEFLTARLDEDEEGARKAAGRAPSGRERSPGVWVRDGANSVEDVYGRPVVCGAEAPDDAEAAHIVRHAPDRVLAEVEARRRIIQLAYEATGLDMDGDLDRALDARAKSGIVFVGERILRVLAAPYASHADYDKNWRP